ncbi:MULTISPECIES: permease [unclassified Streptomyces]|uniref:permease n=1 Tax=unclassified Streptomyces TaxID=2593676 RepID=UPI00363716AB
MSGADSPAVRRPGSGRRLWWQLLRVGASAGRAARGSRLRFLALLLAAAFLTTAALAAVAAAAAYDGRDARERARGPVLAAHGQAPVALWLATSDSIGSTPHWFVKIWPLTATAPPPPGLKAWPAPGEAVLSPELARVGAAEGITSRYGRVSGVIGESGLASPAERLAYARPLKAPEGKEREDWTPISGYGRAWGLGEALTVQSLTMMMTGIGGLLGLPALAFCVIAVRVGSAPRDRRTQLLGAIGAGRRHRALVDLGEALLPVVCGVLAGCVPFALATAVEVRLPETGFVLNRHDVRAVWPLALGCAAGVFVLMLAMVVALHRLGRTKGATRPRRLAERVPHWRFAGLGASVVVLLAGQFVHSKAYIIMFAVGTIGCWAFLPSLIGRIGRRLGTGMAAAGRRRGGIGMLVGGRWTAAHPGVVIRLATAVIIGLGLVVQLQLWTSRSSDMVREADATRSRIGTGVTVVRTGGFTDADLARFGAALPAGSDLLVVGTQETETGLLTTLDGPCPAMRRLHLSCTAAALPMTPADPRVGELLRWYGTDTRTAVTPGWRRAGNTLLVVSAHKDTAQLTAVKEAAFTALPHAEAGALGDEWVLGASNMRRNVRWVMMLGTSGLLVLLAAAGVSTMAEFRRFSTALAPLVVLTGRTRVFRSVAFWHLTVPMVFSVGVAMVFIFWDSTLFLSRTSGGHLSTGLLLTGGAGAAVLALLTGALASVVTTRAARRWRPVAD